MAKVSVEDSMIAFLLKQRGKEEAAIGALEAKIAESRSGKLLTEARKRMAEVDALLERHRGAANPPAQLNTADNNPFKRPEGDLRMVGGERQ